MDFDAFYAGVKPGGLRTKNDIRILICYMLTGTGVPLSGTDIIQVLQENGLANYFEVMDGLAGLLEMGNISVCEDRPDAYTANEKTQEISRRLNTTIPVSVREQAVAAATNLLAAVRRERENQVEILHTENGYEVTCHISGGDVELMSFSLYVPDLQQARLVKRTFLQNPENIYRVMLALVSGNREVVSELLKSL